MASFENIFETIYSLALFSTVCVMNTCTKVEEGHVGVARSWFGRIYDDAKVYQPGIRFSPPWEIITDIPTKEQKTPGDIKAVTKDKKNLYLEYTINYNLADEGAKILLKEGLKLKELAPVWVIPTSREVLKELISRYNHAEILNNQNDFVQIAQKEIGKALEEKGIQIKKFTLPYFQPQGRGNEIFLQIDTLNNQDKQNPETIQTANTFAPQCLIRHNQNIKGLTPTNNLPMRFAMNTRAVKTIG